MTPPRYRVALYAPDRAMTYDGRTPDDQGVGGGITARLAMVEALAAIGHDVTAYVNCEEPIRHAGVRYEPVASVTRIDADVLVAISTGGALTFAPLRSVDVSAHLRILWVQGVPMPADVDAVAADYVYVASNFLRDVCVDRWGISPGRVFVCYNGLKQGAFASVDAAPPPRDPFALAYIGPPEKGLSTAIAILNRLRASDQRYSLHVFGGARLWGRADDDTPAAAGVVNHGLLGQRALARELLRCEYLLAPQAMEEGFGIAVQEARRAGLIAVVSAVGSFPELITPDVDGYLVGERYDTRAAIDRFTSIVLTLAANHDRRTRVRAQSVEAAHFDWTTAARTWTAHWVHLGLMAGEEIVDRLLGEDWIALPDGRHSRTSGYFVPTAADGGPLHLLIAGYYGRGNLGDEAILGALVANCRARRPSVRVTVASGDPEETRARHGVDAVGEHDLPRLLDAVAAADVVVLGGGGLFHDHFGCDPDTTMTTSHWGLSSCATVAVAARALGRPVVLCGVGVGPLTTVEGRRLTRLIVDQAERVTVRDAQSAEVLSDIGVERQDVIVTADLAFLCESASASSPPVSGVTRIAVAVRHWDAQGAAWQPALAWALDDMIERHQAEVVFIPFQAGVEGDLTDDTTAAARVQGAMRHAAAVTIAPVPRSPSDAVALLSSATVVVAMRLHAAILASAAGTPVIALAYDPKVQHAMDLVDSGEQVTDLTSLDGHDVANRIDRVLANRAALAARLRARLPLLRAAAARNVTVVLGAAGSRRRSHAADPSPEWEALLLHTLVHQTRRAATHEAGVAFLRDALARTEEARARLERDHSEATRLLAERGEDLAWFAARLAALEADLEWRPEHSYRAVRRTLARYARGAWRRLSAVLATLGGPPVRAIGRAYTAALPERAREAMARSLSRRLMTWPAYTFDRYRRARAATYGPSLATVRAPGERGLVSVVLPAYNGAPLICEAIDSVLRQTWRRLELIIVNDGSTDDTPQIADRYARVDPRVRVIHQSNLKLPAALSRGFRAARGEYLTWTSCDNRLRPTFLARMVDCLERHPAWDAAYANLDIIGDDGRPLRKTTFYGPDQHPPGSEHIHLPRSTATLNTVANNSIGAAFLYRSRVAHLIGDYSPHRFVLEDYDYWMRVNALMVLRHVDFDDTLYEYRFHDSSLTARWDEFDMLGHRDRLMVFEDFRRDFLLAPVMWLIEGEEPLADQLRTQIERAGHLPARAGDLASMPRWGVPVVHVRVTGDPARSQAAAEGTMPDWVLRAFVSSNPVVPDAMPETWDVCLAVGASAEPVHLSRAYQGWIQAADAAALFHALDIRAKSEQLRRIEALVEAGPSPSLAASVVICTTADGETLRAAVAAVAGQTMATNDWELIVVDNNPSTGAVRRAVDDLRRLHFDSRGERLRLVTCPIPGLSAARNAALFEARGEIVAFIDDDAIAEPDWLQVVCAAFAGRPALGVVGGHIRLQAPEPRPDVMQPGWEKYWSHFVTEHQGLTEVPDWRQFPWGANWTARRTALRAIGGFRTRYGRVGQNYWGGEELVAARLIQRLGYTIAIEPAAVVSHRVAPQRFTREHVERTLPAGYHVGYLAVRDGYLPATSSALWAAVGPLLTNHVDRAVAEGPYRRIDAWYRKRAQLGVLGRAVTDIVRRVRRPIVDDPRRA